MRNPSIDAFYRPHVFGKRKDKSACWTRRLEQALHQTAHRNDEVARRAVVDLFKQYANARDAAYEVGVAYDIDDVGQTERNLIERAAEQRLFTWGFVDGDKAVAKGLGSEFTRYGWSA